MSTIAPSTTPTLTIPLVFALAGPGTGAAYIIALVLMMLVAFCISAFAGESSSPGSLYVYTRESLPPAFSALTALALFFAYVATASAVMGGLVPFAVIFTGPGLTGSATASPLSTRATTLLFLVMAAAGSAWIAYREIKLSARLMLYIEVISVCLIGIVVTLTLWKHGFHLDAPQFDLNAMSPRGIRLGVMLAIFSFVGFESATALGAEAREPLRSIPRAVKQSALLAGLFFGVCCYGEVLGFRGAGVTLDASSAPMRTLATQAGVGWVGPIIDIGVLISMFAAVLGCVIAASRVLLLMAHDGLVPQRLSRTHARHETPAVASLLAAVLALLPAAVLGARGASGADIYGWMGTLAVYGFLTAYGLVAVALAIHRRQAGRLTLGCVALTAAAALAMVLAVESNLLPVPPAPYRYFPYLYAAYLALGLLWLWAQYRRRTSR